MVRPLRKYRIISLQCIKADLDVKLQITNNDIVCYLPYPYSGQNFGVFPLELIHDLGVCNEQTPQAN